VQFGGGVRPVVTEYVGWLTLDRRSLDEKDVLSGGIERLNLASPGFLAKAEGATTQVTPILVTSPQAMQMPAEKFSGAPDPVALLRAYKPEGKLLMLAARIAGTANSAYPDGCPSRRQGGGDDKAKPDGAKAEGASRPTRSGRRSLMRQGRQGQDDKRESRARKPQKTSGRVNAIVIADTDLLADQFWVDVRDSSASRWPSPMPATPPSWSTRSTTCRARTR
jgi:ABC-type uncharacterized transport system involved in gliding motility auxiliary subunit